MPRLRPSRAKLIWLLATAAFTACSESSGPKVEPVDSVTIVGAPVSLQVGATAALTAQTKDGAGVILTGRTVTWLSSNNGLATIAPDGTITGVAPGSVTITATSEGRSGTVVINIILPPVSSITVNLGATQLIVGQTTQATAVLRDGLGNTLTGRPVAWSSSLPSVASVDQTGNVTAVAPGGPVAIIATSEGISGNAALFVAAAVTCTSSLQLGIGEVRTLTGTDRTGFCLGGASASTAEYVLIPFNSSTSAGNIATLRLSATNTSTPVSPSTGFDASIGSGLSQPEADHRFLERQFRIRERADLLPALQSFRRGAVTGRDRVSASRITGMPANPAIGSLYPINTNISSNTCSGQKVLHEARVVSVTARVIVLIDTQSPTGGYTDAELADFGTVFESNGYNVDTLNFGAPSDIDSNGRIVILFTPAVNALATQPGFIVGGLQAGRDLFPVSECVGSNEGEMFYMPVPDPSSVINGNYTNKTSLANRVQTVLAHEFQHLINAGRRIYINNANTFEEVWLNEGLSHIAEELVYYHVSGNAPRQNIDLPRVQSSQAQLDAINNYQVQNLGRLLTYMNAPEPNSPYAQNDELPTRGATWQLLRFAADRKGGTERNTWRDLANSATSGLNNFANIFGSVTPIARDWVVAQYADDLGIPVASTYLHPSWNFRSLLPAINQNVFPLQTRLLLAAPLDLSINGGSAAYVKFRVGGGTTATVSATTSGQPPPAGTELMLLRIQ